VRGEHLGSGQATQKHMPTPSEICGGVATTKIYIFSRLPYSRGLIGKTILERNTLPMFNKYLFDLLFGFCRELLKCCCGIWLK
jgi:hypothetical protein